MRPFTLVCATLVALTAMDGWAASKIEARRYRTADGVEVIVGRDPAAPVAPAGLPKVQPAATASWGESTSTSRDAPVSTRVTPREQADRDRDRLAVLNAELLTEGQALEQKRQALRSPRVAADLTSEQLQALRASAERHEENIRALEREIRRTSQAARGTP